MVLQTHVTCMARYCPVKMNTRMNVKLVLNVLFPFVGHSYLIVSVNTNVNITATIQTGYVGVIVLIEVLDMFFFFIVI